MQGRPLEERVTFVLVAREGVCRWRRIASAVPCESGTGGRALVPRGARRRRLLPAQQLERAIVSLSSVTAPLRASTRPSIVTPVVTVMLVSARMLPRKVEPVPSVAELPTCQKTLHERAPLTSSDLARGGGREGRSRLEDEDGVGIAVPVERQRAREADRRGRPVDTGRERAAAEVGSDRLVGEPSRLPSSYAVTRSALACCATAPPPWLTPAERERREPGDRRASGTSRVAGEHARARVRHACAGEHGEAGARGERHGRKLHGRDDRGRRDRRRRHARDRHHGRRGASASVTTGTLIDGHLTTGTATTGHRHHGRLELARRDDRERAASSPAARRRLRDSRASLRASAPGVLVVPGGGAGAAGTVAGRAVRRARRRRRPRRASSARPRASTGARRRASRDLRGAAGRSRGATTSAPRPPWRCARRAARSDQRVAGSRAGRAARRRCHRPRPRSPPRSPSTADAGDCPAARRHPCRARCRCA